MLPPEIQCVFLSATLSNAEEFAEWIHEIKSTPRDAIQGDSMGASSSSSATAATSAAATSSMVPAVSRASAAVHHRATCHVVYTNTRPVPLTHYMFLKGGSGIYQIKNDKLLAKAHAEAVAKGNGGVSISPASAILKANFQKIHREMLRQERAKVAEKAAFSDLIKGAANRVTQNTSSSAPSFHTNKIQAQLSAARAAKRAHVPDIVRLVSLCVEQDWLPSIFFSFSRRECEGMSLVAIGEKWKLDLTTKEEKEMIGMVWSKAMEGLDVEDRRLPPLQYMYPLLLRGFAVHHSGLLPLLKEVVEILFSEGLVKVLFATETFAMGLNMPARSVIFSQLSKFDGRGTRFLQASEYIQMAGRAGRRGVDTKGVVIMMLDKSDIEATANGTPSAGSSSSAASPNDDSSPELGGMISHLLTGSTDPLQSKFRLTYNMILNLIRCSSRFDPSYILSQSFLHFQSKNPFKQHQSMMMMQSQAKKKALLPAEPLTTVSGKRARMGEGGISSLSAAGAQVAEERSRALGSVAELQSTLAGIENEVSALNLSPGDQALVLAFQQDYARLRAAQHELYELSQRDPARFILPFLQSGRLVFIQTPAQSERNTTANADSKGAVDAVDWGWGIVVHWRMRHAPVRIEGSGSNGASNSNGAPAPPRFEPAEYVVDVLLPVRADAVGQESLQRWGDVSLPQPREGPVGPQGWENGEWFLQRPTRADLRRNDTSVPSPPYHIVNCSLSMLHSISAVRLYLPPSLQLSTPQALETRKALFLVLDRATDNFAQRNLPKVAIQDLPLPSAASLMQPGSDEGRAAARTEQRLQALSAQIASTEAALTHSLVHRFSHTAVHRFLSLHSERESLRAQLGSFSSSLGSTHLLSYRIELKTRLRILRRFRHLTPEGIITNKGRIAADIECADELLLTEFLYEGHWTALTSDELMAVLTAWLDVERSSASRLALPTESLKKAYASIRELASSLASVSNECGLVIDSAKYVASFKQDLIPITYAWVSGNAKTFAELAAMSDLFEGTVIRLFRRLDEMCNQLIKAAQAIGEKTLEERLVEGQKKMKRGIIFAGSLYI